MKQSITVDQYKSLSEKGKLEWKAWCLEKGYGSTFAADEFVEDIQPTIGILLEFLDGQDGMDWSAWVSRSIESGKHNEFIDDLYEYWKEILES